MYGVYKKRNSDGTVSDSLMKLAADLPMNEGIDADVVAGTRMTIKVDNNTHTSIHLHISLSHTLNMAGILQTHWFCF